VDPGFRAFDSFDGDLTGSVSVEGNVDTAAAIGTQFRLVYSVRDSAGNSAAARQRDIVIADTKPPRVQLLGPNPLVLNAGDPFTDPGATALDAVDGVVTPSLMSSVPNTLPEAVPQELQLTYTATDRAGNMGTAVRTLVIVDTEPPFIALNYGVGGEKNISVPFGTRVVDPGAQAHDLSVGNLTDAIEVIGLEAVDVKRPGAYQLEYRVKDRYGNIATVLRHAIVESFVVPPPRNVVLISVQRYIGNEATTVDAEEAILRSRSGLSYLFVISCFLEGSSNVQVRGNAIPSLRNGGINFSLPIGSSITFEVVARSTEPPFRWYTASALAAVLNSALLGEVEGGVVQVQEATDPQQGSGYSSTSSAVIAAAGAGILAVVLATLVDLRGLSRRKRPLAVATSRTSPPSGMQVTETVTNPVFNAAM
jgi:hypothetical protein